MISSKSPHYVRLARALAGRIHAAAALALFAAVVLAPAVAQAQEYNRALRSQDIVLERVGSDGGWMISGRVAMDVQTTQPRDLSFQLLIRVNGQQVDPVNPGAYGWVQRLIFGLGVPGGGGGGVSCVSFCATNCQNGSCNYYQYSNIMCMCANNEAGANVYLPSRFAAPMPPLRPGDEVIISVLPLAGSPALPEIRTDDDVLVLIVPTCTAPTMTTQPQPASTCPSGSATFSVAADGTGPFTYQWQWRPTPTTPPGGQFTNVIDGVNTDPQGGPIQFTATGARTGTVGIENTGGTGTAGSHWEKRCIVTNSCGSATSNAATLTITICRCSPADIANTDGDVGFDGTIDNGDFTAFFNAFFLDAVDPNRLAADIANTDGETTVEGAGPDGAIDNGDFTAFFAYFFQGCATP